MVVSTSIEKLTRTQEAALVQRVIRGEAGAFDELYNRYNNAVRRAVVRVVQPDDIDDVAQKAWLLIYNNLSSWQGTASFKTWAHQIAFNSALVLLRTQKNDKLTVSLDASMAGDLGEEARTFEPSFEERAYESVGDIDKMRLAISQLPDLMRAIILMHNQGASNQEVAEALGITVASVKTHLFRVTAKLRLAMGIEAPKPKARKAKARKKLPDTEGKGIANG